MFLHIVPTANGYTVLGAPTAQDPATSPLNALADEDPKVRSETYRKLVELGNLIVMPLIQALRHSNTLIRTSAARILGDIHASVGAYALVPLLTDETPMVRDAAFNSLVTMGQDGLPALLHTLVNDEAASLHESICRVLQAMARGSLSATLKPLLNALERSVSSHETAERIQAVLEYVYGPSAFDTLALNIPLATNNHHALR